MNFVTSKEGRQTSLVGTGYSSSSEDSAGPSVRERNLCVSNVELPIEGRLWNRRILSATAHYRHGLEEKVCLLPRSCRNRNVRRLRSNAFRTCELAHDDCCEELCLPVAGSSKRSEERRVGKERRSR